MTPSPPAMTGTGGQVTPPDRGSKIIDKTTKICKTVLRLAGL